MAIVANSPLGFSARPLCDCRNDVYTQIVARRDNPVWQIVAECDDNVIVGNEKLPCENNLVGEYWTDFKNKDSAYVDTPNAEVSFFRDFIQLIDAQNAANYIGTADNYLTADRFYLVRYSITGYTGGYIHLIDGDDNAGPIRQTNGTFTEIIPSGPDGRFAFRYGPDDDPDVETTLDISNIFVGCIRISQQWTVPTLLAPNIEFTGQTGFCVDGAIGFSMDLRSEFKDRLIIGQVYRICFTVSQQAILNNGITLFFGLTSESITASGYYCFNIEYEDDVATITFDAAFAGCIQDIEITLVPTIKVGLFDSNDELVEDGLVTTVINNTIKVQLAENVPDGCYNIGVADSCSNYKHQFFGDVLDVPNIYSPNMNLETGGFLVEPDGNGNFQTSVLFPKAVCCEKNYTGNLRIDIAVGEDTYTIEDLFVVISIGGNTEEYEPALSFPINIPFAKPAGCENEDFQISIRMSLSSASGTNPIIMTFNLDDRTRTYLLIDENQFCPEFFSGDLKVTTEAPCDTVLIEYRNDTDAMQFDYTSPGYTEADNFYNKIRIEGKVWKGGGTKEREVNRSSNGRRTLTYSDTSRKRTFNTGLLPECIHDALMLAPEHRTFRIDGIEYVSESPEYNPDWSNAKNSTLASAELELRPQDVRKLNTLC